MNNNKLYDNFLTFEQELLEKGYVTNYLRYYMLWHLLLKIPIINSEYKKVA